ncbi:RagB/SusD family nutrient uptake outer membrane protein [Galbibacter sp. EGI 63066]|uniref:RagB/SusD family nutrient uptake outer membrane protein n=1 Tax=Galbibacter sp. EGI 63066 TaxID=2993559 RepID=UPI002248EDC5|nr:RagB/SusD family nutrient uptake outer membrane protein [Galbibacter sp. EGI 63066]MCX2679238.1 RagB/SusD family nutrient uptake outer membrane protein [Galbibacter sp. EGI 63066]
MKKLIYTLPIIAVFFFSCELEKNPYDQVAVEELFEDPGSVEAATLGNYSLLKGDKGFDGWADDLHRITEYPGDNVALSGGTTDHLFFLYNYQAIATNSRVNRFWRNSYKIVVGCNVVIEKIIERESEETDQLLGENYYLRALVYFQMGNIFGRPYNQGASNLSIPLKLTSDTEDRPDRNTVQEVYDQVIADLEKAASLMTINKGAPYASKGAAEALLSRVYLYMEDNTKAIEYADKVIQSGEYTLLPTNRFAVMNTLTPEENEEAIFNVKLSSSADLLGGSDHWFTPGSMYASVDGTGWGEMYASRSYLDLIDKNPEDTRKSFIEAQYLTDENGEKIPAIYWVNNEYKYEFARTTETAGVTTFEYDGSTYTLQSEEQDGKTVYYFNGPDGRQDVIKDYDMQKRNGYPKFFILKASLQEEDRHLWSPTVSRLAEMHLNKAEAYAKQGMDQQALDQVNIIRERAGVPTYTLETIPSGSTVLDVVLEERRLELAYEGHRKFDVYRNGRTMDRRYPGTHLNGTNAFLEIPPTHARVIEFIPEQQIILQPSLIQND